MVKPLGFSLDDKQVRRAGLDYHEIERISVHESWDAFLALKLGGKIYALSTKGRTNYANATFCKGDILLFGPETRGLPEEMRNALPQDQVLRIPMRANSRSLNLSNTVAIVVYEALRQLDFEMEG